MSDDNDLVRNLSVGQLREIIREEMARGGQYMTLPYLPAVQPQPNYMACACGPGQCARMQVGGVPCAGFRQWGP